MGRKHKRQHQTNKENFEAEQKGFEALSGTNLPAWWHEMDEHQAKYVSAIEHYKVVMVDDKSGTSKTTIAVAMGLQLLKAGKVDKIHYVRFPDRRSLKLGYLAGNEEKEAGYMHPFYEAMAECGVPSFMVEALRANGIVETSTDIHMRGRTLSRVYLIIDEAQNGDISDLRLVLTRIKDNGKAIVIGHTKQVDSKMPTYGRDKLIPFEVYQLHMLKKHFAVKCRLYKDYRGEISQWADEIELTLKELENTY